MSQRWETSRSAGPATCLRCRPASPLFVSRMGGTTPRSWWTAPSLRPVRGTFLLPAQGALSAGEPALGGPQVTFRRDGLDVAVPVGSGGEGGEAKLGGGVAYDDGTVE